jgi:hypothetical protein
MVLTEVLAEICMSDGPKMVAPVSLPETASTAESIACSMKGRAMTMGASNAGNPPLAILTASVSHDPMFPLLALSPPVNSGVVGVSPAG